jgi:hypothetical protein
LGWRCDGGDSDGFRNLRLYLLNKVAVFFLIFFQKKLNWLVSALSASASGMGEDVRWEA